MPKTDLNSKPSYPWTGCGADKELAGCRFSLYPLDNRYPEIILGSLKQVDTSKVWSQTDSLSTVYRGRIKQIFDCLSAVYVRAYREDLHLCLEGQASCGCPGDVTSDSPLPSDDIPANRPCIANNNFTVKAKLALYPMGLADYLPIIADVFYLADSLALNPSIIHYATSIEGPVLKVFDYLATVSEQTIHKVNHFALHFTVSVNSPTNE
jgi:uncharacterized protein YqgV (UPF0045/DUF77 family)